MSNASPSNFLLLHYYTSLLQQIRIHHRKVCASGRQCQAYFSLIIKTQTWLEDLIFDKFIVLEGISFHVDFLACWLLLFLLKTQVQCNPNVWTMPKCLYQNTFALQITENYVTNVLVWKITAFLFLFVVIPAIKTILTYDAMSHCTHLQRTIF